MFVSMVFFGYQFWGIVIACIEAAVFWNSQFLSTGVI
jgi:hypothetical protein